MSSAGQEARAESLRKSGYPVSEGPTSSVSTRNNAVMASIDFAVEKRGGVAEEGSETRPSETPPTNSTEGGVAGTLPVTSTLPTLEKPDPGSTEDIAGQPPQPEAPPTTSDSTGEGVVGQTELPPSTEGGVANGKVEPSDVSTATDPS